MAKLVDIWRCDQPVNLTQRQMPLIVDETLTMIMDLNNLGYINESPLAKGKQLEEFKRKLEMLTKEEVKASFKVTHKDMLSILSQTVPCVGCRRSVERLFFELMGSGHQALDPLIVTPEGILTISEESLLSPRLLCTMLQGHSDRLHNLVERQPRNKKSLRCALHSMDIQRMRPPANAWKEAWDVMKSPCRQEVTLIETDTLEATLETYLRKHRFCGECRTKVLLASTLLTSEPNPSKEKGYVAALYKDIKQVLTCLGICVANRLHRIHRRLKEEETICRVFAAVAIDALSRNFQMAVEEKQGISQLELLYEELTREELVKQQRREKLRLKRKKKKERKYENTEEKENNCECLKEKGKGNDCICTESKPTTQNNDRHKLQILDPKNKGQPTCKCPDCLKKTKNSDNIKQTQSQSSTFRSKNSSRKLNQPKVEQIKDVITKEKEKDENPGKFCEEDPHDMCSCYEEFFEKRDDGKWHLRQGGKTPPEEELLKWVDFNKRYELKLREIMSRASSEPSQDCGYSSEHNVSSSSLPSTPEGSEVACSEGCCSHDGDCPDNRPWDKLDHSRLGVSLLGEQGLTLTQMLEVIIYFLSYINYKYLIISLIIDACNFILDYFKFN
ncbi:Similar to CG2182: Gametogenetin-binding protein 2-like (Drosophila melanogaster) [Cotesia congregata]|uniref:Similar to CG2182: Gametogenetin-binding protein 2-like (Drosophila melanogaster) n=1 Tax=Cotesia congregata TaxID=51543 RepID=A0A8J2H8X1_COTCN|nr:Similar to CG2182: Gametogenetin-binding protein 2-like (Drosophila melanogaster) [Cotesia congregata]